MSAIYSTISLILSSLFGAVGLLLTKDRKRRIIFGWIDLILLILGVILLSL